MKLRRFYFWLPAYLIPVVVVALFHPGVWSPRVHWAESVMYSAGYPLLFFAIPYWIARRSAKSAHPAMPAAAGLVVSMLIIALNARHW